MKPSIVDVGALDGDYFSVSFSNGHLILFRLAELIRKPDFAALMKSKTFEKPKTDGEKLYWTTDGPSLYFDEIMKVAVGDALLKRTIILVEAHDGDSEIIDIELDNRTVIMFSLKPKLDEPLFAEVVQKRLISQTDGNKVYWQNGENLTLEEITEMLRTDNSGELK